MSIGKTLRTLMDSKGLTAYELADYTGISQSTLSRILNKDTKPSIKNLKLLADYFKVTREDLLGTEALDYDLPVPSEAMVSEPFSLEYSENNNANTFMKLENGQYVMTMPLAEFNVQAGLLDHYQDLEYINGLNKHTILVDEPVKGRYIAFRVKGDSMDDGSSNAITPNSIVTTRELGRHHWTSKLRYKIFPYWIIYTTESKMPLLKEITKHDTATATITCHSLNDSPEYRDFELSLNDVQALFYVIDVNRSVSKRTYY